MRVHKVRPRPTIKDSIQSMLVTQFVTCDLIVKQLLIHWRFLEEIKDVE